MLTADIPAVQNLISSLLNQGRSADQRYHLVVLPEDDWPRTEEFDDVNDMIARIRELLTQPCHLFPFLGTRLAITKEPNRFLRTPLGALPLFDMPSESQMSDAEHGWVGPELDKPQAPTDVPDTYGDEEVQEEEQAADVVPVTSELSPSPQATGLDETPMFADAGDS